MELDVIDDRTLRGFLIRHNKNPLIKTPLTASHGIRDRFEKDASRVEIDLKGKWSLEMIDDNNIKSPAVATFSQKDKFFTGSILTSTGDYRYLEGQIRGHSFEAASFDGVYNYIFRGNVSNGQMKASLLSNSITHMSGKLNPKAHLPDAFAQTELSELKFILPDLKGQSVNLNHSKFLNKPVIVQIFGSWCPNCVDEMNYLIPWYHENAKRGVEIIALAFERSLSVDHARKQLLKVQKKFKVPYLILQAGSTAQDKPSDALPGLKNFISFPTTLFLNKNHQVVKVHAGFSGPSTGEFFESWKTEFNHIVDEILK
jgi:thiol-disulfide isomerase/thioredoxin